MPEDQYDNRAQRRRRQTRSGPEQEDGKDREAGLVRCQQRADRPGQRRSRLIEGASSHKESEARELGVAVAVIQNESGIVGTGRAVELPLRLRVAAFVGSRAREIRQGTDPHHLSRFFQLRERDRGVAGIVFEMSIQELEPPRAVETARHRWRKRRDGLLGPRGRLQRDAPDEKEKSRETGNGKRETARHQNVAGGDIGGAFRFPFSVFRFPASVLIWRADVSSRRRRASAHRGPWRGSRIPQTRCSRGSSAPARPTNRSSPGRCRPPVAGFPKDPAAAPEPSRRWSRATERAMRSRSWVLSIRVVAPQPRLLPRRQAGRPAPRDRPALAVKAEA